MATEIWKPPALWSELGYDEVINKLHLANDTAEAIGEAAASLNEITEEDALIFGPDFVAYYGEAITHNVDRISLEIEACGLEGDEEARKRKIKNYDLKRLNNKRLGVEKTLFNAARGDYRGVKYILAEKWQHELGSPYWGHHALALMRISNILPDFADPFIPPLPAWLIEEDLK